MTEDDEPRSEAYLRGKLDALEFMLNCVIDTLPTEARTYIHDRVWSLAHGLDREQRSRQTDVLRDRSAAAWEVATEFDAWRDANVFAELRSE